MFVLLNLAVIAVSIALAVRGTVSVTDALLSNAVLGTIQMIIVVSWVAAWFAWGYLPTDLPLLTMAVFGLLELGIPTALFMLNSHERQFFY